MNTASVSNDLPGSIYSIAPIMPIGISAKAMHQDGMSSWLKHASCTAALTKVFLPLAGI
ncbi:hypothetical protein JMJ77_0007239 [Colletotrichum scovillei]|uniref:Uncharacterized protein n=1 Tax=Colletotrichum scovillei TaxID=1209932 RepID=A0A9P7RC45_9PEZI|nr:hypothetical protein JMJ77_0007239 [Colletotrichum scovillei]KAG7074207.1 hypothetical protein JMJ76_0010691 [Colletotrichum scovillei]KAG7081373.1 hypothetical protein JMJ78_0003496 [Colletotrichum scovillei]